MGDTMEEMKMCTRDIIKIVIYIMIGISLLISAITDIKYRKIYISVVLSASITAVVLNIFAGNMDIYEILGIAATGLIFFGISFVSGGQLGAGDACIYILRGIGLGIVGNIYLIFISFIAAGLYASYLVLFKRKRRDYKIPLVPYIMIGYIVYFVDKAGGLSGVL